MAPVFAQTVGKVEIKVEIEPPLYLLARPLPLPDAAVPARGRALAPRTPLGPRRARARAAVLRLGGEPGPALWRS